MTSSAIVRPSELAIRLKRTYSDNGNPCPSASSQKKEENRKKVRDVRDSDATCLRHHAGVTSARMRLRLLAHPHSASPAYEHTLEGRKTHEGGL